MAKITVKTEAYNDQKPGTSGLRKRTKVFMQVNYTANFIQSILLALDPELLKGSTIVLSGDGRFYNREATLITLRILAANGVGHVIIAQDMLMSTPSVSAIIRDRKAYGGIILTASHNPGGIDADFGIKYNCENGGPAPSVLTSAIYEISQNIHEYYIYEDDPIVNWSECGIYKYHDMNIEIMNACENYGYLMKSIFNFNMIRKFVQKSYVRIALDAMHGVAGPFLKYVLVNMLGCDRNSILNATPSPTFNNGHPDPNLTYAHDLVRLMGLNRRGEPLNASNTNNNDIPYFGAAADGDADRCMVLGRKFFVTPSDSLAILTAFAQKCIPYFKDGIKGVARSMPTSQAVDRVASAMNIKTYEVPTGWKYFGNLMDDSRISLCGEESFGTGSDHIREKDGIWCMLAWLSILAYVNRDNNDDDQLIHVSQIVHEHWLCYGRNYYCRYDYEDVDKDHANNMMNDLIKRIGDNTIMNEVKNDHFVLKAADEFTYVDPVDKSIAEHQGIRLLFEDGSRLVFRLSGTGSVGATIRLYIEKYENSKSLNDLTLNPQEALKELIDLGLNISKLEEYTGRNEPTVIT